MTFAKPSGAQTKTTNRSFEKLTVSGAETFKIKLFWSSLVNFQAVWINLKFKNKKRRFLRNLAERKPKRLTALFKNQKRTIFVKPSGAQTKTTNRSFEKS